MFLGWFGLVRQVSSILVTSGLNVFFFLMQDVKQIYDLFSQRMNRCNRILMEAHFIKCIIRNHMYNHEEKSRNTFLRVKHKSVLFHMNLR